MKTVMITGGTRGIGRALTQRFFEDGYRVLFIYRDSVAEAENLERMGAVGYRCDIGNERELESVCQKILKEEEHVDILINNAGIASFGLFTETTDELWRRVRSVNLDGPLYLCRAFAPCMIRRQWGRIVNISSMWGQVGASCEVLYSTAKAGLIGLSKALAKELGPSGITVNCVCPGIIDTDMNRSVDAGIVEELMANIPVGRLGTVEEVAALCRFLAHEQSSYITGQILGINGGYVIT